MKTKKDGEETFKIVLRMPSDLSERIKESASKNRRSMNNEMIVLLEKVLMPESKDN